MSTIKRKIEVVMLPTQKAHTTCIFQSNLTSRLGVSIRRNMIDNCITDVDCSPIFSLPISQVTGQHLYFISNDDIKEGDWKYNPTLLHIVKHEGIFNDGDRKIIGTTDFTLNVWGPLPQPSALFVLKYIEEFNKGNIILDVMVEYDIIPDLQSYHEETKTCDNIEVVKVDKTNHMTITKTKDSWIRKEMEELVTRAMQFGHDENTAGKYLSQIDSAKWIKEHL